MKVYGCIDRVTGRLSKAGITKDRKNVQQGYGFRGIDDVLNALSPILAEEHLVILPRIRSRRCSERQTKSGGVLFSVTVKADFDFVAVEDGSKHTVTMYGEGMDSADKATNKAMSAAYKYAAIQAFCIPTAGGNHEADETTPEPIVAAAINTPAEKKPPAAVPPDFEAWLKELHAKAELGGNELFSFWNKSQPYLRKHLTDSDRQLWEGIKAKAATVKPLAAAK